MKNLKQVLALGMAFSLTMSTMAGAAFTDSADIKATEAVDMLSALGVIKGYEDGSFKPEGTVTRAEAAKMIFTIRNGGNDDASAFAGLSTSFTDLTGYGWAEGYIKYCQANGIIAGKSATSFDPGAQVTGVELAKMMLVTMGYDATKAGLTGATWSTNTLSLASEAGLLKDVAADLSAGLPRQYAAQLMYNTLTASTVRWSTDGNAYTDLGVDNMPNETVGYKYMDLTYYVGRMTSSGDMKIAGSVAGNNQFIIDADTVNDVDADKYYGNGNAHYNTFKDGKDHSDLVGQEVKVLTGKKADQVYGVYPTGTSKVVETTMDKIEVDTKNDKFIIGDVKYSVYNVGADVYVDGVHTSGTGIFTAGSTNGKVVSDKVKLVDWDNNGKYETIMVETASVAQITYVGTDSITIGSVGSRDTSVVGAKRTFENSEISLYEGAAKGDYVVITKDDYNKDNWKIEKATVVTGTVDGVVNNERKVRVNGTWYTLANDKIGTPFNLCTISGTVDKFVNKDEVTLYVVGDVAYYAEATKGNDVNRQVAMVYDTNIEAGGWNSTAEAKIITPDGTKKTITVASIDGKTKDNWSTSGKKITDFTVGNMYSYTINNDGEYEFTSLANTTSGRAGYDYYNGAVRDANNAIDDGKYDGYTIADDAIVFAYGPNSGDARVYTGKAVKDAKLKLKDSTTGQALVQESTGGLNYVRMMAVEIDATINTSTNYGYLVTDGVYSYNKELASYVMEYTYWNGTEVVTATEKTSNNKSWAIKGEIISFANDSEGFIKEVKQTTTLSTPDTLVYASMTGVDTKAGYVALSQDSGATSTTYEVTSDTLIYYVNADASSSDKIGVTSSGYDFVVKTGANNVAYVADSNNKVLFMVIDVDGKLK